MMTYINSLGCSVSCSLQSWASVKLFKCFAKQSPVLWTMDIWEKEITCRILLEGWWRKREHTCGIQRHDDQEEVHEKRAGYCGWVYLQQADTTPWVGHSPGAQSSELDSSLNLATILKMGGLRGSEQIHHTSNKGSREAAAAVLPLSLSCQPETVSSSCLAISEFK